MADRKLLIEVDPETIEEFFKKERNHLANTHRNKDALTASDLSWITSMSMRRGMFRLIKEWVCSEWIWNVLVGNIAEKPLEEHSK